MLLTRNIVRHAIECGAKVVFSSSAAVYGEHSGLAKESSPTIPECNYGLAKLLSEALVRQLEDYVIFRYFNVVGPGPKAGLLARVKECREAGKILTINGDGEQTRDFVRVEDVARANVMAALGNQQGIFNIGSGQAMTVNEAIAAAGGCEVEYGPELPGEIRHSCADTTKFEDAFGFRPRGLLE